MSWQEIVLGECLTIKHGFAFKSQHFGDSGEHIVLTPGNFHEPGGFRLRPGKNRFYTVEPPEDFVLQPGDLVIAMTEQGEGLLGSSALIPEDGSYLHNQRIGLIKNLDEHKLTKGYLYRLFNTPQLRGEIRATASGTKVRHTAPKRIYTIKVKVPPVVIQRKIAGTLSAYDALIENNRRRIGLLEEAARLLYREWFVYFRFPGHEHVKIINGIPEGWERLYLGDVVTTQYGHTASASDEEVGPKFVRGTDINKRSFIDWSTVPYCTEQSLDFNKYALVPGDILVIRMADPGRVGFVEKSIRSVFASYLVRLKLRNPDELPPIFLFMTLMEERYQGFIGSSSVGSTRKSASARLLTDFHFAQPPKVLLKLFIEQVAPIREMITKLLDQSAGAAKARDLLLPRLMNWVSQNSNPFVFNYLEPSQKPQS